MENQEKEKITKGTIRILVFSIILVIIIIATTIVFLTSSNGAKTNNNNNSALSGKEIESNNNNSSGAENNNSNTSNSLPDIIRKADNDEKGANENGYTLNMTFNEFIDKYNKIASDGAQSVDLPASMFQIKKSDFQFIKEYDSGQKCYAYEQLNLTSGRATGNYIYLYMTSKDYLVTTTFATTGKMKSDSISYYFPMIILDVNEDVAQFLVQNRIEEFGKGLPLNNGIDMGVIEYSQFEQLVFECRYPPTASEVFDVNELY